MRTGRDAMAGYYGPIQAWHAGDLSLRLTGGETGAEVLERFDAVVDEIAATGTQRTLLVSHGAVIRLWAGARASGLDPVSAFETPLANACAIVVERPSPRADWRFHSWQEQPWADR